ncbi:hypothetical protein ACLMJK_002498 [Lecanora helva]
MAFVARLALISLFYKFCLGIATPPGILLSNSNTDVSVNPAGAKPTLSLNKSLPIPLNALPSDPYTYLVPDSGILIEFSRYRNPSLVLLSVYAVLLEAANQVNDEIRRGGDRVINPAFPPTTQLEYHSDGVQLVFLPSYICKWSNWGVGVRGITDFVMRYTSRRLNFEVHDATTKVHLGWGYLDRLL